MLCVWCNIKHVEEGTLKTYCSDECHTEANRLRAWCKRRSIRFIMPKTTEFMGRYERAIFLVHPWQSGDVNAIDPDLRARIKWLRVEGMTLREIHDTVRESVELVRSVLEGEI